MECKNCKKEIESGMYCDIECYEIDIQHTKPHNKDSDESPHLIHPLKDGGDVDKSADIKYNENIGQDE